VHQQTDSERNRGHRGGRTRPILKNIALLLGSLVFSFVVIESGYRVFDPFPFFSPDEINRTEHGNLSDYDWILGWKGVPGETEFTTENKRIRLAHNAAGFRDIEHQDSEHKPALVFLGISSQSHNTNFSKTDLS